MGRPLTLMGADRQMVISGIFIGLAAWLNLHTLWAGAAVMAGFMWLGRIKAQDPIAIRLLFNGGRHRTRFDAAKTLPFSVIFANEQNQ